MLLCLGFTPKEATEDFFIRVGGSKRLTLQALPFYTPKAVSKGNILIVAQHVFNKSHQSAFLALVIARIHQCKKGRFFTRYHERTSYKHT